MNAGLGNLATLKSMLLPEAVREQEDWDAPLLAIGLGVAASIERHCNRRLARVVGDTCTFSADRTYYTLPRFPIESIASVEIRSAVADGWVAQPDAVQNYDPANGIIEFAGMLGARIDIVRVTWTGGYHYEALEPSDAAYPTASPTGSAALPQDLRLAWLLQCQHTFEARDHLLPAGLRPTDTGATSLGTLDIVPEVRRMLFPHIRFQIV